MRSSLNSLDDICSTKVGIRKMLISASTTLKISALRTPRSKEMVVIAECLCSSFWSGLANVGILGEQVGFLKTICGIFGAEHF